ncbi:uncharacterized protein F5891DRAFT_1063565 [Suillus fuscotomentosus]|uniref:F-box domain-containing protein n=1 Tax=Suillus fuscotomentosus TaxID=1912939 RepID=A0AAD4DUG6_9AGAM|nr:uncharacterized protein F5891DRAFT_1063565 [Suillus fuscotomentosus]KAG1894156.1 hypothetical protein F5891DRAFT_1063565 [Suillus fuscotomentosus]
MSFVPPELVLCILEHGYYTSLRTPNYTLLKAAALVCKTWSGPAQTLLFRCATKLEQHNISIFPLGECVRILEISIGGTSNGGLGCSADDFVILLQACPQLYELALSITGLHEFEEEILQKLGDVGRKLKALTLVQCGLQSPILFQLLKIWNNIQFLKIEKEIAAWPWRTATTPVLRRNTDAEELAHRPGAEVCLYELALSRFPTPDVLTWLLESSADSLRILELRDIPGPTHRPILSLHAPRLRSLRLGYYNIYSAALLRMCTALEELVIYHVPTHFPLAPDLPPTIEHLSFRNPNHVYRNTLQPIIEAVDALPSLKVLTCDKNAEQLVGDYEILKAKCRMKGTEVIVSDIPFWVYEDPVKVHRFPRTRSVSNFDAML